MEVGVEPTSGIIHPVSKTGAMPLGDSTIFVEETGYDPVSESSRLPVLPVRRFFNISPT